MNQIQMRPPAAPASQATQIEKGRAEAEVMASVMVAKQCPRDEADAERRMFRACGRLSLAEKAFYSYPRGGGDTVSGPSIHLATELALIWGNLHHGVMELSRDEVTARSEVLAFAWDLESNSRRSGVFISPHRRDTKNGSKALVDMRDVYENNQNNGARRMREAIFAVMPGWFVDGAIAACNATLKQGNGKPLDVRIQDAVNAFESMKITVDQLETKLGCVRRRWAEMDVVELGKLFRSLDSGQLKRDDAFPPPRTTVEEAARTASAAGPSEGAGAGEPNAEADGVPVTIWDRIAKAGAARGWDQARWEAEFSDWSGGELIGSVDDQQLESFVAHMTAGAA